MDESRARALLRAERAEVATLLRQTEEAATLDDQASDIPEDFGDAGLPLTENADDEDVAGSCATGWRRSTGRWPGSRPAPTVARCSAASRSRRRGLRPTRRPS